MADRSDCAISAGDTRLGIAAAPVLWRCRGNQRRGLPVTLAHRQAQLARVFGSHAWPAAKIIINDFGATPAVVRLRLEQALEALNALAQS